MPGASLLQNNTLLVCFINVCLHAKNESQMLIFKRDIEDQRMLKSVQRRACRQQGCSRITNLLAFVSLMSIYMQKIKLRYFKIIPFKFFNSRDTED